MPKIFTIGFSGKGPDAFMDVLNAVRVRTIWDVRLWRISAYVPFYSGENTAVKIWQRHWATDMNITLNLPQPKKY